MEKHTVGGKYTQPLSSASAKKTRRGKECAAFSEGTATGIHFFQVSLTALKD